MRFDFFAIAFLLRMLFLNKITIEAIPVMLSGVLLIFGCGLLFSSPFREKVEISPRVAVVFLLTTVVVGAILRVMLAVWLAPELNSDYLEYHRNALYILEGDFRDLYTRPLGYPAACSFDLFNTSRSAFGKTRKCLTRCIFYHICILAW